MPTHRWSCRTFTGNYCKKLAEKLNGKEHKEPDDRTVVLRDGHGRHWTNPEVLDALRNARLEKEEVNTKREQKKAERATKAKQRMLAEEEWKRVVAKHERLKAQHAVHCQQLLEAGTSKKNLPRAPQHELQASVFARFGIDVRKERRDVQ